MEGKDSLWISESPTIISRIGSQSTSTATSMAKECWKKKEKETRKYFKCNKEEHIVKNCKGKCYNEYLE